MTAELTPIDAMLLRLAVLTVLQSRVAAAVDDARTEVLAWTKKGDSLTVAHPDDDEQPIATVSHTKPKRKAEVTDRSALDAWILANYPDKAEPKVKIVGSHAEAVDVLREHAPWLVDEVREVADWARNELLRKSATAGEPIGYGGEIDDHAPPGISVSTPDGWLRVAPALHATEIVDELWINNRVDLDGNLLELPAGGEH